MENKLLYIGAGVYSFIFTGIIYKRLKGISLKKKEQEINHLKFIYNAKRYKSKSVIKTILNNNNYKLELLKSLVCFRKDAFLELEYLKNNIKNKTIKEDKLIKENDLIDNVITEHNKTKKNSLTYGLSNEISIYNFLTFTLSLPLEKSLYPYSLFDFYDKDNCILYELKSLSYSIKKYRTAIMNIEKLIYNRMIFLFEYTNNEMTERKALYYYVYDPNIQYNRRMIKPFKRLNYCEIFDIPIYKLKRLRYTDDLKLINKISPANDNEKEKFNEIIDEDKLRSSFLEEKKIVF